MQPDLVVVLNEKKDRISASTIEVAPDIIVEILSPGTASYDRKIKMRLFERAGVNEYWIVDPIEETFEQYVLIEGVYSLLSPKTVIQTSLIGTMSFSLESIW